MEMFFEELFFEQNNTAHFLSSLFGGTQQSNGKWDRYHTVGISIILISTKDHL